MWVVHEKHTVPARCKSRAHAMQTTLWMSPSHVLACVHAANTTQAFGITRPCMLNERACMCVWWWQPSTAQASKFVTGLSRLNSEPVMHCTPSRKQGSATVRHAQNEDQCSTLARCRVIHPAKARKPGPCACLPRLVLSLASAMLSLLSWTRMLN